MSIDHNLGTERRPLLLAALAIAATAFAGTSLAQTYPAKPASEGRWEAHRQYADIQFIASGRERMGIAALRNMREIEAYDAGRDVAF